MYNTIFKTFMYIGLFSNAAFVFFADNYFLPDYSTYNKINIYCVFVFGVFLLSTLLTWNVLPPWFEYLEDIKESYLEDIANKLEPKFTLYNNPKKIKRLTFIDKNYFRGNQKRGSLNESIKLIVY